MTAQIFRPHVGRRYRIHNGDKKFTAIVTAWTLDSVTVKIDRVQADGEHYTPVPVVLHRGETLFEEWL